MRSTSSTVHCWVWHFTCLALLGLAGTSWSYQEFGPGGGGRIAVFASKPNNPNIIIAGTNMGGISRTTNGGQTWTTFNWLEVHGINHVQPDNKALLQTIVWGKYETTVGVVSPTRVFLSSVDGFYYSDDDGATWQPVLAPSDGDPMTPDVPWDNTTFSRTSTDKIGPDFICCPKDRGPMLAACNDYGVNDGVHNTRALFVSWDGGFHWWPQDLPAIEEELIIGLMVDESVQETPWILVTNKNIYHKATLQSAWSLRNTGLPANFAERDIKSFAGASRASGTPARAMYVALEPEPDDPFTTQIKAPLYKSMDGGVSWSACKTTGLNLTVSGGVMPEYVELAVARTNPNVVFVCYEGGLVRGKPLYPYTGNGGVYKSTNAGTSWTEAIFEQDSILTPPRNVTGKTWGSSSEWTWCQKSDNIYIDPFNGQNVLAGKSGLMLSTNQGANWTNISEGPLNTSVTPTTTKGGVLPVLAIWDIAQHPAWPNHRYLCCSDYTFFHTRNGGDTWIHRDIGYNNVYSAAVAPVIPTGGKPELWVAGGSLHGLPNWNNLSYQDIATAGGGLAHTTTDWDAFDTIKETNELPHAVMTSVWLSPTNKLWVAAMGQGFYWRTRTGITWTRGLDPAQLPNASLNAYKVGGTPEGGMYALATASAGGMDDANVSHPAQGGALWLRPNESYPANNWTAVALPDLNNFFYPVDVDFATTSAGSGYIFIACLTKPGGAIGGIFRRAYQFTGGAYSFTSNWVKIFVGGCSGVTAGPNFSASRTLYVSAFDGSNPTLEKNFGIYVSLSADTATAATISNQGPSFGRDSSFPGQSPWKMRFLKQPGTTSLEKVITTRGQGIWR